MTMVVYIILFSIILRNEIWCVQLIPERAGVLYTNNKYIEGVKFFVQRYSRRSNYFINLEASIKQEWNNNVTVKILNKIHFFFYEYLHNEYKRSFVEMHFRLCDLVLRDPYIGKGLANAGMPCPIPKGKAVVHNITVPMNDFPNVVPFERCRVDIRLIKTSTDELLLNIEAYLHFKNPEVISKYNKKSTKLW